MKIYWFLLDNRQYDVNPIKFMRMSDSWDIESAAIRQAAPVSLSSRGLICHVLTSGNEDFVIRHILSNKCVDDKFELELLDDDVIDYDVFIGVFFAFSKWFQPTLSTSDVREITSNGFTLR